MASIYGLVDPETKEIRYIGKANKPEERLKSHMRDSLRRDTPVYCWIRKIGKPEMVILIENSEDWKADERRLIKEARERGDRLLNLADGGDQPHCSYEVRAENGRKASKARDRSPDMARLFRLKCRLGRALKDGWVSEKTKAKMRKLALDHPSYFSDWADVGLD